MGVGSQRWDLVSFWAMSSHSSTLQKTDPKNGHAENWEIEAQWFPDDA